jgi:hypothetical protein
MKPGALFALVFALLFLAAAVARAGTEEFSTFSVYAQEEDDESLIDHMLTRPDRAWRDEWERSVQALRTSQGCFTSGQWFIDTQLKLRTSLGGPALFGLDVRDQESDASTVQYFDFSFRFPTAIGTPGFMFRPMHDKSLQDLALFWEAGKETSATVARLTFTFEDVFNDLFAFRQARVGQNGEPYEKHPFEPAAWVRLRRPAWDFELNGQWLTPSIKRLAWTDDPAVPRAGLWGAYGYADLLARAGGFEFQLTGNDRQARSSQEIPATGDGGADYRRQWAVETVARRPFGSHWESEAHWLYQERHERSDSPYPDRLLDVVERVLQGEVRYRASRWTARTGAMHDRVSRDLQGDPLASYATRIESRAYVGLGALFGRVSMDVVEGIELDPEPYDVWFHHDKAFLHLQTTF